MKFKKWNLYKKHCGVHATFKHKDGDDNVIIDGIFVLRAEALVLEAP